MDSGIYCYENKNDGKKYVGLSSKLTNRIKQHEKNFECEDFSKTNGENKYLWNAVRKYGRDNFSVYILERCTTDMLEERELFYIKNLESHVTERGYNILWGGFSRLGAKHSQETKDKISKGNKGKIVSQETRKKMSNAGKNKIISDIEKQRLLKIKPNNKGENNPMFGRRGKNSPILGRKHTSEEIRKISDSKIGVGRPQSVIDKLKLFVGEKHHFFGKQHSHETKRKISESTLSKKHGEKTSSKYLGVSFYSKLKKWKSSITINHKQIYIGVFEKEVDAAIAYDKKSWNYYKDSSKLNFPKGDDHNA